MGPGTKLEVSGQDNKNQDWKISDTSRGPDGLPKGGPFTRPESPGTEPKAPQQECFYLGAALAQDSLAIVYLESQRGDGGKGAYLYIGPQPRGLTQAARELCDQPRVDLPMDRSPEG